MPKSNKQIKNIVGTYLADLWPFITSTIDTYWSEGVDHVHTADLFTDGIPPSQGDDTIPPDFNFKHGNQISWFDFSDKEGNSLLIVGKTFVANIKLNSLFNDGRKASFLTITIDDGSQKESISVVHDDGSDPGWADFKAHGWEIVNS